VSYSKYQSHLNKVDRVAVELWLSTQKQQDKETKEQGKEEGQKGRLQEPLVERQVEEQEQVEQEVKGGPAHSYTLRIRSNNFPKYC